MKIITRLFSVFLAGVFVFGGSGCDTIKEHSLTGKLWSSQSFRSFSEPAFNPKLALFRKKTPDDVLVLYDRVSDRNEIAKRRAYFLQANLARISAGGKPRFVDPALAGGAIQIPLLDESAIETNPPSTFAVFAVTNWDNRSFVLYRAGRPPQSHRLPVYEESSGAAARVALTPLAVAGDATVVGMILAIVGVYALGESNAHFH